MLLNFPFNKQSFDDVFNYFAAKCIKHGIKGPINLYVVGGASIVMSFEYRKSTIDIDAYYENSEELKLIIAEISKELEIPSDWINNEFVKTPSYSPKIMETAKLRSNYQDMIYVYTLDPEYIIAMKLKSSRPTGGDMRDITYMVYELRLSGSDITYEKVMEAYDYLYDNDHSYTYEFFFDKTKEAFNVSIQDIKDMLGIEEL